MKTPTATFLVKFKTGLEPSTGRVTVEDSCARDFIGIPECETDMCAVVERFINEYYGGVCVEYVVFEQEEV